MTPDDINRGVSRSLEINEEIPLWARYAQGTAGRPPTKFFEIAVDAVQGQVGQGRLVLDLGSGAGNETIAFLERGWRVHAIDAEPAAVEILESRVPPSLREYLTTTVGDFSHVELPKADLVFSSLSLPFAGETFPQALRNAIGAVAPHGWLVAVFLGPKDSWAKEDDVVTVDRSELTDALSDFEQMTIEEEEFDGPSGAGPKHWHWFIVVARRSTRRSEC